MGRKEQAYEYIKNAILLNQLRPGTPVREMELAEELQMSRTPIREAMRDLEAEGLVVSYASRGTFVSTITPYDVEEIGELRALFEEWSLERGFWRITDQELDYLQNEFERAHARGDREAARRTDRLFHKLIVEKSGSKRMVMFMSRLNTQIERIRLVSTQGFDGSQRSYDEHLEIIGCIRARDLEKSKAALKKHLRSVDTSAMEAAREIGIDLNLADI
jgi:DNA-binding GntR family transcriptional regulator